MYSIVSTNRKLSDPNFDPKTFQPLVGGAIVLGAFVLNVVVFSILNVPNAGWFIAISAAITLISFIAIGFLNRKFKTKN